MTTDPDIPNPEDERLSSLFDELQQERVEPHEGFEDAVVETVRWQRVVNSALTVVFSLTAAFADALSVILGRKPPDR